jgi:type II secretory pathway pseudopilin PulG
MQSCCNYISVEIWGGQYLRSRRRALTLVELVVVLAILVALAGMVVPLVSGMLFQANASTNATVVGDVNGYVRMFFAKNDRYPNGWDSLLNTSGSFYSKLHPNLTTSGAPILQTMSLSPAQADSLNAVNITKLFNADESQSLAPNMSFVGGPISITTGATVASLVTSISPTSLGQAGFNLANLDNVGTNNAYVVLGLGPNTTLRSVVATDVPLINAADPTRRYARVLCVFMVPGASVTTSSPAKYVGCFLPDGTSLHDNLEMFNNTRTNF